MPPSCVRTRPPEFCPICASYLTISPRPADSAQGFRNYFTCRACPYIYPVSESGYSADDEPVVNKAVTNKPATNDPAANKPVPKEPITKEPV
ncbi:hypothetical protein N7517_008505 [Penicillium concentricum]|uniref:DNA-directed RNA polymerase M/15kDa subunit domain-containing protein n=1 Tax=Penicillium concentricum TaxID=293559 RepID=A0A9W9V2T6_9EURO|nr:uncharacterized protein N7517_008505 [Penicillium concentricum]KAJ5365619.1 hypothetical protein N7517_008505 [Penicillium concentricum]